MVKPARVLVVSIALSLVAGLAGCAARSDAGDEPAAQTADLSDAATLEAALVAALDPGAASSPEEAAAAATMSLEEILDACFTTETLGRTTTYTFDHCSGSWGLVDVDGTLSATWTPGLGTIRYDIVTEGFTVSGASFDLSASVVARREAEARTTFEVTSTTTATGPRGHTSSTSAAYVVVREGDCYDVDGSWTGSDASASITVTGFHSCAGACPESGVVESGRLTLTFDGSSRASWSLGERSGSIPLFCE